MVNLNHWKNVCDYMIYTYIKHKVKVLLPYPIHYRKLLSRLIYRLLQISPLKYLAQYLNCISSKTGWRKIKYSLAHLFISGARCPQYPDGQECRHSPYWRIPSLRRKKNSFCWHRLHPLSFEQDKQPLQMGFDT